MNNLPQSATVDKKPSIFDPEHRDVIAYLGKKIDSDLIGCLGAVLLEKLHQWLLAQDAPQIVLDAFNNGMMLSEYQWRIKANEIPDSEYPDMVDVVFNAVQTNLDWGGSFFAYVAPAEKPLFYEADNCGVKA
jgi:hypothetical protein